MHLLHHQLLVPPKTRQSQLLLQFVPTVVVGAKERAKARESEGSVPLVATTTMVALTRAVVVARGAKKESEVVARAAKARAAAVVAAAVAAAAVASVVRENDFWSCSIPMIGNNNRRDI